MDKARYIEQMVVRSRRLPWLIIGVTFTVLAAVVILTTLTVRHGIRDQIAGRDGEVLQAVASMLYAADVQSGIAGTIADPATQLDIALQAAQIRGVMGVRLFGPAGDLVSQFPPNITDGALSEDHLARLARLLPAWRYHAGQMVSSVFVPEDEPVDADPIPVLEISIPFHEPGGPLVGVAQFLIEGNSIQAEYARLDQQLTLQAAVAIVVGGGFLGLALGWAFRRLRRSQDLLSERTENLVKANRELAFAARTSALGTVTAHLIHGLKNPLSGLQNFMASRTNGDGDTPEEDWLEAIASTRRMRTLVGQVVSVIREEEATAAYEVTVDEILDAIRSRAGALAEAGKVILELRTDADVALPNRTANLVILILTNLLENAIQATPAKGVVRLDARPGGSHLLFELQDEGPGFPEEITPFAPCSSTREGGTGIGLALSKQLASHLGAELELTQTSSQGCLFTLSLPLPTTASDYPAVIAAAT